MSKFNAKKYNNSWKAFDRLSWNLYQPLNTIKRYDGDLDKMVSANDVLKLKVPVKRGDRVAIIYYSWECERKNKKKRNVVLSEPILGKPTVHNVLKALERGLRRPIKPGDRRRKGGGYTKYYFGKNPYDYPKQKNRYYIPNKNEVVYGRISNWFDSKARLSLINKYETGKLKPFELLGDHRYFEGMSRKGNMIHFHTGS